MDALVVDARKLLAYDPERFFRILALCRAYLSIYEAPHESLYDLISRLRHAVGKTAKISA